MLRPLGDRVVIVLDKPADVSAGGIILPDSAQQPKQSATASVMAVGPGNAATIMEVKPGDKVATSAFAGYAVEGTEFTIIRQNDILAVME